MNLSCIIQDPDLRPLYCDIIATINDNLYYKDLILRAKRVVDIGSKMKLALACYGEYV